MEMLNLFTFTGWIFPDMPYLQNAKGILIVKIECIFDSRQS